MNIIKYYESELEFLKKEYDMKENHVLRADKYGNNSAFYILAYRNNFREIEFIIDNAKEYRMGDFWIISLYIKNIEQGYPDYKDTNNCFSDDDLNCYIKTTECTHKLFIELKLQQSMKDFIVESSNTQRLIYFIELIKGCKQEILTKAWFSKASLDKAYSEHMGYSIQVGWKEDKLLTKVKDTLDFLILEKDYFLLYDEDKVNRYEKNGIYPKLVYENKMADKAFIILVDKREQFMSVHEYQPSKYFFNKDCYMSSLVKRLKPEYIQDFDVLKETILYYS